MIILYFIIGYIASVFLCRWINKLIYKWIKEKGSIQVSVWLIPIFNIIGIIIIIICIIIYIIKKYPSIKFVKWFKGDNW